MDQGDQDGSMAAVAALGDPLRRALYRFVAGQDHAVGRDEAAQAARVSRSVAAFHLDRLVDDGLLKTEFRRLSGRGGPGAGRPAKLYRRAQTEIAVSLPARHYDLAAQLLAAAISGASAGPEPVQAVLRQVAGERGARLADSLAAASPRGGAEAAAATLAAQGYEPRLGPDGIVLANCPFHALAADHTELVCGMNLALLEGFAAALPEAGLTARLDPSEGRCCVRLEVAPVAAPPAPARRPSAPTAGGPGTRRSARP